MRHLFDIFVVITLTVVLPGCRSEENYHEIEGQHYIAHAGGTIQGWRYSNSLEAVREALAHNIKYVELDLCITADGQLVAWHDWNWQWTYTPTHEQFMTHPVYNRFTPIDFAKMDSILSDNPQLSLVTDKISDPEIIERYFSKYKKRVWVECFTEADYFALQESGFHVLMSRSPSVSASQISNYTYNRYDCADPSDRFGDCFAIYGGDISCTMADSIFAIDERIHFVYTDNYE